MNGSDTMRGKPLARAVIGAALVLFNAHVKAAGNGGSAWARNYFPNVPLITDAGHSVRFFDDLIKGKVVVIHFMSTRCAESSQRATARLRALQEILGDRVGRDVFLYSLSTDPEHDTPAVLTTCRGQFLAAPGWTFVTGEQAHIALVQRKLGLSRQATRDGPNDHHLRLIIGNQATGRWMKPSPLDTADILAAALDGWLDHGKEPSRGHSDHAWSTKLPVWLRSGTADVMLADMSTAERVTEDRGAPPEPPLQITPGSTTRPVVSIDTHTG